LVVVRRHHGAQDRLVAIGIHTHPADRYSIVMQLQLGSEAARSQAE
jgi:DNA-binding GntR family transcriptional regulator